MSRHYFLEKIKFLVVDDNAFMRSIFRQVINTLGAQNIQEANDGAEALKILKTWQADIVLLDWEMTPFDGIELTQMIRHQNNSSAFLPIIMVSGHSEYWRITNARDAGVNEFLAKPISAKALMSRILNVIQHPRPFIKSPTYFGPDRRRHNLDVMKDRRRKEPLHICPICEDPLMDNAQHQVAHMPQYHISHGLTAPLR